MFESEKKQSTVHLTPKISDISTITKFNPAAETTPWRSIAIASTFTFCTAVQFTLYFSSLWPFLQVLDREATETFYGLIVASYSLGQIISGPIVGFWATKTKSIVNPCLFCLTLTLIGNVLYVSSSLLPSNQRWGILVARFFVGLGESSLSLYQGYASTASVAADRGRALSITTGGLAIGFAMGPAVQLLFTPLAYPGLKIGNFYINMYTSPALACCIINILCMVVMKFWFVERYAGLANPNAKSKEEKTVFVPKYDRVAVALCHLTRFVQMFVFTNMETIGTPFVMAIFALDSKTTIQVLSIAHTISGALGFLIYMFHAFFKTDKLDYRKVCMVAFLGFLAFHLFTIPLPFTAGQLKTYSSADYEAYKRSNGTLKAPVGCAVDEFSWCRSTGTVNFWVYMVLTVLILGVFWPNVNVSLSTIFSKILGPRRQSHHQSMFQMAASCARLTGPILISNLYTAWGPMYSWLVEIVILVFILLVWLLQFKRLVPLKMPEPTEQNAPAESSESEVAEEESKEAKIYARF